MEPLIKDSPIRDHPLYKGQFIIISHSNNTFLDLREEDNLSIVDKMASVRGFPCQWSIEQCHSINVIPCSLDLINSLSVCQKKALSNNTLEFHC